MEEEQSAAMTVEDTSSEGPTAPAPPLEASPVAREASALDEINQKLDLLLQAQGISM